jgi:hypothetical protein
VHILAGLLLGGATALTVNEFRFGLVYAAFVGLVFSQASLLGIWFGSGTNPWWIRLIGVLAGVGYLSPQFGICISETGTDVIFLVAFATFAAAAVLLVVRCFGPRIRLNSDEGKPTTRMQFSIRHLMILTLTVACLLVLVKWLQPAFDLGDVPTLAIVVLPFIIVGLLAAWGVLGTKHPLSGIIVLLAVAAGVGFAYDWFLPPTEIPFFWMTVTLIEALSLIVSLLTVRSCGYRLRRWAAQQLGGDPGEIENSV